MNKNIWEDQLNFNTNYFNDIGLELNNLSLQNKVKWTKEFILHIEQELHDVIKCLPKWKMQNINNDFTNSNIDQNIKEEFIDCYKYIMGLAQILNISYEDIIEEYYKKSFVVEQRYKQNKEFDELKKSQVIVFDIDGVINNYPICFVDWVNEKYNKSFVDLNDIKRVSIEEYSMYKEQYRISGAKRTQPINVDTVDTINKLYDSGEKIVLYTVRPVNKYKNIYYDTITWLKNNGVKYNAIFWSDYSKEDFNKLGLNIKYFVDDTVENVLLFSKEGYKSYLLSNKYNEYDKNMSYIRINKVSQILE